MRVTDTPAALPACCIFCPGSVRRRYIDTGLQEDFYGAVYICEECVLAMGRMLGMKSEEEVGNIIDNHMRDADEMFRLQTRLAAAEEAIHGLVGMFGRDTGPDLYSPGLLPDDPNLDKFHELVSSGAQGSADSMGEGTGAPSEPLHDEGVDLVPPDDNGGGGEFRLAL